MAQAIILPKQGLQMTEGTLTHWLKREGEHVTEGEPLFEMETDKLTITIDSTASGTILKIFHQEGETVPITETIAVVGEQGEDVSAFSGAGGAVPPSAPAPAGPKTFDSKAAHESAAAVPDGRVFVTPRAKTTAHERGVALEGIAGTGPDGLVIERDVLAFQPVRATPLAKKIAGLEQMDLNSVPGTGVRGKVTAADVQAALPKAPAAAAPLEKRIPLTGIRKIIAQRMKQSLLEPGTGQPPHEGGYDRGRAPARAAQGRGRQGQL